MLLDSRKVIVWLTIRKKKHYHVTKTLVILKYTKELYVAAAAG